jgi:hypothetical protein
MLPRVLPTNPNAVIDAVKRKKQSVMETANTAEATDANTKYFPNYGLKLARTPMYHSNPVREGRCIGAVAIIRSS